MKQIQVAILMGSDSDLSVMEDAFTVLKQFGVSAEGKILSAHRTPDLVKKFVTNAPKKGVKVFIAGAGAAAHLAGVVASHTTLPVLGVPIDATALKGLDALLATVQMPSGVPVATFAVGKAGAYNAGLFAVEILAISNKALAAKLVQYKKDMAAKVGMKNKNLQKMLAK